MATEKIQELADEYGIPTEVVEEYIEYMGFDADEVDSLNYYGTFKNESDFAEQLVDEGVITDLGRYLYMTATDMHLLAGEEADNRVDNMDDEEVLEETGDNYSPDEVDEAREYLHRQYYDEIHEELEKDAVGYFVDQFGYREEDLAKQSIFSVDYDKLGEDLEYDYNYITHDGDVYVFNNYAKGGYMAKGGSIDDEISKLYKGYLEAVIFTEEENLGSYYTIYDFDKATQKSTKDMLTRFYNENESAIKESGLDLETIGNDIWYTRSGQGAGFFDHSLDDDVERKLINGAKKLGEYPSVEENKGKLSISKGRVFAHGGETDDDLLEFTIPNWALSSLINGDDSGLEDEDIEKIDRFVDKTSKKYGNANFMLSDEDEMDLGFRYSNDIDNMGSECSLLYLRPTKGYDDDSTDDENYAKGGVHNVNKKYSYFAVNKKTNKIVDGWEIVDDVESLKYYAKMDLKDNDMNPSDYNLLSAKTLKARGIDPYSWDSWAKTGEYADGGMMAKGGYCLSKIQTKRLSELASNYLNSEKVDNEPSLKKGYSWFVYDDDAYLPDNIDELPNMERQKYGEHYTDVDFIEYAKKDWLFDISENLKKFEKGGVTFDDKVNAISRSLMERKKVSPSVQKDYGKTYSRKEAIDSAKRIAGAMRKKEMSKGGYVIRTRDKLIADDVLKYADLQKIPASYRKVGNYYSIRLDDKIKAMDSMTKKFKNEVYPQLANYKKKA